MKSIATHSPSSVVAVDEPSHGGAHHHFQILGQGGYVGEVQFQCGPRGEPGSVTGCFTDDLLAIVEEQMRSFQAGPYSCEENERCLILVAAARDAMAERVAARAKRGVLGKNEV